MVGARVAYLIDAEGIPPDSIWLISAARNAVSEIDERITDYLKDPADAHVVKIATLHPHATEILSGFTDKEWFSGPFYSPFYGASVEEMCARVRQDEEVAELLDGVDHLVVDEGQGLQGSSAVLVIEMIRKLHEYCGVTVFSDEAQASDKIRGDRKVRPGENPDRALPERIRRREAGVFRRLELPEPHRAGLNPPIKATKKGLGSFDRTEKESRAGKPGTGPSPISDGSATANIRWDASQQAVIEALAEERLLVSAGPGTGKTAVACARVSHLIDEKDLAPNAIWMISFTRTAVREIRDRIAKYVKDPANAYSVKLDTLDSRAWKIQSGFSEEVPALDSYDHNIRRAVEFIRHDEAVSEFLESVEHLVVDETQDLVGVRADLVIEMIRKLDQSCGVTVFADEAQAIYGFADHREVRAGGIRQPPLPARISGGDAGPFQRRELAEVHRTSSPNLLKIFGGTRRKVLAAACGTKGSLEEVRQEVRLSAHGNTSNDDNQALDGLENAFILYRRRCDVLQRTSFLSRDGIPHRVRMSGLPVCLAPWIGGALSEHSARDLTEDTFRRLWDSGVESTAWATCGPDEAWKNLIRVAGRTQALVDMGELRQRLGTQQPPAELCLAELGDRGPVVGTIHASKGLEAETVHLLLPLPVGAEADHAEEARVVFVGATRGRSRLLVGYGYHQGASQVKYGRAYSLKTRMYEPKAQVEIGRDGDISAEGLAGRRYFEGSSQVRTSQARIRDLAGGESGVTAVADPFTAYAYRMRGKEKSDPCLAVLSQRVNRDLFEIAQAVADRVGGRRRPPDFIPHLRILGVRTIVVPLAGGESEKLHEPWNSSGILLAPIVLGYATLSFPTRSR